MSELIRVLVVGDRKVGKTCMLTTYITGVFPTLHAQTVCDVTTKSTSVDGQAVQLCLWDTASQDNCDKLRINCYPDPTNVVLLCFSLVSPESMDHVTTRWAPELKMHRPQAPIILVGTKKDYRDEEDPSGRVKGMTVIKQLDGIRLAEEIGAVKYMECSALTSTGLDEVFADAVRATFHHNVEKRNTAVRATFHHTRSTCAVL